MGFIDNNSKKQGNIFKGLKIYSPNILRECEVDYIVILTDFYDEIYQQIIDVYPEKKDIIVNKNFFYQRSLLKRYEGVVDPEKAEVLNYIKNNGLDIFNYKFSKKYKNILIELHFDIENGMYYTIYENKRLYFSKKLDCKKKIVDYYRYILMEQDPLSPHRYLTDTFKVEDGDVVVDVGAAEGNFSLEVVDKVSKLYIIETDIDWINALKLTFKDYLDKVIIIQKFISTYDDDNFVTLDSLLHESVNFIKMDIEGNEWDALQGAKELIRRSKKLKCAICSYHSDFDKILIENFMDQNNLNHFTSDGYIWFPLTVRQNYVSTCLNRAIVRGEKGNHI